MHVKVLVVVKSAQVSHVVLCTFFHRCVSHARGGSRSVLKRVTGFRFRRGQSRLASPAVLSFIS